MVGMRPRPSAVGIVAVFARPAGRLDDAVQRDVFDDLDLSHVVSLFYSLPDGSQQHSLARWIVQPIVAGRTKNRQLGRTIFIHSLS